MMRLLVSVRSRQEVRAAVDGGADIVDAKEPSLGALGPVSLPEFSAIAHAVGGRRPVTAAIGDAESVDATESRARAFGRAGASFVKVGLSGVDSAATAARLLAAAARGAVPAGAALVAVAYADYGRADCLEPHTIVKAASAAGTRGVLLDTAAKGGPGVLQLVSNAWLEAWIAGVHAAGMFAAVGGRLSAADLAYVGACGADVAGVRGAACEGGRTGIVSLPKVQALAAALRAPAHRTWPTADRLAGPAENTDPR